MNEDELLLLLMQTIRVNGNTLYLLEHGYTFSALNRDIDTLKELGYVICKNEKLFLTKEGMIFFYEKNKEFGRKGLYKYMSSLLSSKDEPMPQNKVYVPLKRKR